MEKKARPWRIKQVQGMYEKKGTLSFDHPIQRKGSQWGGYQKSLFIHSIASDFPIPPFYTTKIDDIYFVLDGKQRMTTAFDFINDMFKLHDDIPLIDGFDARGMFFSELPEELRETLQFQNLLVYELEEATDDEIEDIFYRLNNGTTLTSIQKTKARMGGKMASKFEEVLSHSFLSNVVKLTPAQVRKEDDLKLVVQSMMIREDWYEGVKSFGVAEVCRYAEGLQDNSATDRCLVRLKETFDYGLLAIEPKQKALLKPIHVPMLVRTMWYAIDQGIEIDQFRSWFLDFSERFQQEDMTYKEYCDSGSTSASKVKGRVKTMETDFKQFVQGGLA
ncbi:hypothetical protein BMT55_11720 [Listeria newyorkensis]|uniref:GmrSD restriction endonucleases N-terminal domain-containing protein n=1 Tax=Listeria newyorkensis TaxID=1497681 RepID=A0ABX4XL68_9LIST|nr:DUF262 domain-containing protein [Listeria newyorkensis]PNP90639.1 hypothetical protein BMT55_11720 [Listeria newyorkensis]